jgi:hypothetical protein
MVEKSVRAVGSNEADAALAQPGVANLLHHEVARESVGGFDDDRPDAIGLDALEHQGEAWPGLDRIGAAYSRIVELVHKLVTAVPREGLDGLALAFVAVLVGADVQRVGDPADSAACATTQNSVLPKLNARE